MQCQEVFEAGLHFWQSRCVQLLGVLADFRTQGSAGVDVEDSALVVDQGFEGAFNRTLNQSTIVFHEIDLVDDPECDFVPERLDNEGYSGGCVEVQGDHG